MHEGHRDRMRERIKKDGIEGLQPHEILEFLLYSVIPRKDTNEIAHDLISTFGSFSKVLSADYERLKEVKGMTDNAALFLSSLPSVYKTYVSGFSEEKKVLNTRGDLVRFLSPLFFGEKTERFYVVSLDSHNKVLNLTKREGIPQEVRIDVREIVDIALKNKAVSMIIAHNHPSGDVSPSRDDIELTRTIVAGLKLIKVRLIDHYIFSDLGYYSFSEDGLANVISENVNNFLKEGLKY